MKEPLETTLGILNTQAGNLNFVSLVRLVMQQAEVDEATAKASILRLSFEGRIGIDSDWSVSLCPAESEVEGQTASPLVAVAA